MLGIDFLKKPIDVRIDGFEFMDYQKSDLFKQLVPLFESAIVMHDVDGLARYKIERTPEFREKLESLVLASTGICLRLYDVGTANMGIDSGYMNPGNILNIRGIEALVGAKDSNIGDMFKRLKSDVLKGWIDTSTGKIGGGYSKIEFKFVMNDYIDTFIGKKFIERYKVTMPEALAGILLHECGHIFTGLLYVHRSIIDPILSTTAIKQIVDGKQYGKERVTIIREAFKCMDVGQKVVEEDVANMTGDELVVYFNKAVGTRDTQRTLSLGTVDRASEIYADLYAARMGCPKQIIAGFASMGTLPGYYFGFPIYSLSAAILTLVFCHPIIAVLAGLNSMLMMGMYLFKLVPGSTYDTPYRRLKTILRDYIVQLNNTDGVDNKTKVQLLQAAKEMEEIVNDSKSYLEGTWVQRTMSYMVNGSDFRAQEFEHYTDELIGTTLSLYKNAL